VKSPYNVKAFNLNERKTNVGNIYEEKKGMRITEE
jgi:hypothetical protein